MGAKQSFHLWHCLQEAPKWLSPSFTLCRSYLALNAKETIAKRKGKAIHCYKRDDASSFHKVYRREASSFKFVTSALWKVSIWRNTANVYVAAAALPARPVRLVSMSGLKFDN